MLLAIWSNTEEIGAGAHAGSARCPAGEDHPSAPAYRFGPKHFIYQPHQAVTTSGGYNRISRPFAESVVVYAKDVLGEI